MPSCREFDQLVTPYVDGEATAAQKAVVDAHMRACPPCRQRAAIEAAARESVRTRLCRPTAPEQLRTRCLAAATQNRISTWTSRFTPASLAMAAALVIVVGGVFLYGLTRLSATVLAAQLAVDHVVCFATHDSKTATDVRASEEKFAHDFGWTVKLPEVESTGLEFVGLRRCFCAEGPAAHAMYRFDGRPISLYMIPGVERGSAESDAFGHDAVIWSRGGATYVLLGREPEEVLEKLAAVLNQKL
jgi:anti-sigma factor (TIGR02949 family)